MANKKEIQIVTGDGKDLEISPVYEHLEIEKPKENKKQNIVVPEEKKIENVKKRTSKK